MRMAFGLVSVLVVLGIIVFIMKSVEHPADTVRRLEPVKEDARQLAGQDKSGMKASESITLDPRMRGSKLEGMLVTWLVAQGPMQAYFGLQVNDVIVEIAGMKVGDVSNNDGSLAEAMIWEAYQRRQALTVLRQGYMLVLEPGAGQATAAAAAAQTGEPQPSN